MGKDKSGKPLSKKFVALQAAPHGPICQRSAESHVTKKATCPKTSKNGEKEITIVTLKLPQVLAKKLAHLAIDTERPRQDLVAEALLDLMAKYDPSENNPSLLLSA